MILKRLVFTDLDGTLLDHHTYSFAPALPMLAKLKSLEIPVIPTTSKTRAELIPLRQRIGLTGPFIIENGAAIYVPNQFMPAPDSADILFEGDYWIKYFSAPRQHWLDILNQQKSRFKDKLRHYSEMSIADICAATGLSPEDANLSAQREFGEPVLWLGSNEEKNHFLNHMRQAGVSPLEGGRFIHICGQSDKGKALTWFSQHYLAHLNTQVTTKFLTIALGDGNNDIAMLNAADIAVRIASPSHSLPKLDKQTDVYTSTQHGPAGWAECLSHILKQYQEED